MLVLHGGNDTNVPVGEAEQVVDALKKRGVPVNYVLFPEEGHGWRKISTRIQFHVMVLGNPAQPLTRLLGDGAWITAKQEGTELLLACRLHGQVAAGRASEQPTIRELIGSVNTAALHKGSVEKVFSRVVDLQVANCRGAPYTPR
jgi:acetyl esterase/lipase